MRTFLALTFGISVGVVAATVVAGREVIAGSGFTATPAGDDPLAPSPEPPPPAPAPDSESR